MSAVWTGVSSLEEPLLEALGAAKLRTVRTHQRFVCLLVTDQTFEELVDCGELVPDLALIMVCSCLIFSIVRDLPVCQFVQIIAILENIQCVIVCFKMVLFVFLLVIFFIEYTVLHHLREVGISGLHGKRMIGVHRPRVACGMSFHRAAIIFLHTPA